MFKKEDWNKQRELEEPIIDCYFCDTNKTNCLCKINGFHCMIAPVCVECQEKMYNNAHPKTKNKIYSLYYRVTNTNGAN